MTEPFQDKLLERFTQHFEIKIHTLFSSSLYISSIYKSRIYFIFLRCKQLAIPLIQSTNHHHHQPPGANSFFLSFLNISFFSFEPTHTLLFVFSLSSRFFFCCFLLVISIPIDFERIRERHFCNKDGLLLFFHSLLLVLLSYPSLPSIWPFFLSI